MYFVFYSPVFLLKLIMFELNKTCMNYEFYVITEMTSLFSVTNTL